MSCRYDYILNDYQGNVRAVISQNGVLEEVNAYYPYGGLLGAPATGVQARKYGGKELDRENGLDWYDFEARMYDPMLPQFKSIDRKAEDNSGTSPFVYCAGNPIRYTDPTGMNPVYDRNGIYLGDTSEGFTGEVLVMRDGYAGDMDISKMTAEELQKGNYVQTLDMIQQSNTSLSGNALSNIWTDVLSHFNGLHVYDCVFDISKIQNREVGFIVNEDVNWLTQPFFNANPIIYGTGNNYSSYESTVENIASSLIVHEWYSHGMKLNRDSMLSHRLAYKNVINFKPLWNKTTPSYKEFVLRQLKYYTEKETGRSIVDKPYRYSYKIYVNE